jgi:squalene synthase HpnC
MAAWTLDEQLAAYGPAATCAPLTLAESEGYCRRLARTHYENFTVATWLLPRSMRQHFCNLYAYCRWADDLADETASVGQSLALLDWWEGELERCYRGEASHPVFIALLPTVREFEIPRQPFGDLIVAFRRDQTQTAYNTYEELLDYCRYSANPVGHLVLYLGGAFHAETARLADQICTGLQLANHWQDVARDYARGRIYLPAEDRVRWGVTEAMLAAPRASDEFRQLLAALVTRAEQCLTAGLPLLELLPPELRLSVRLFASGGMAILAEIRRQNYDVLERRPTVGKWRKVRLLAEAWRHTWWDGKGGAAE